MTMNFVITFQEISPLTIYHHVLLILSYLNRC